MPLVVADTHAMIWYFLEPRRLSPKALATLDEAIQAGEVIAVASISVVEVIYLVEKGRLPLTALERLYEAIQGTDNALEVISLDLNIARSLSAVPRERVPDMPDRIIVATALYFGVPLVSRDRRIQAPGLEVIW